MFTCNDARTMRRAQVDFTCSGWKQFMRINRNLGVKFIQAFVLKYELAEYLAEHEGSGTALDESCQEVRYDDGIYLLLKKMQGVWYITDVFLVEAAAAYEPIFCWQRIRRGASFLLAHMLIGWRQISRKAVFA